MCPQPTTNEGRGIAFVKLVFALETRRSEPPLQGGTHSLALDYSIRTALYKTSRSIFVNVSAASRARDAILGANRNKEREGQRRKDESEPGRLLLSAFILVASEPSSGALLFGSGALLFGCLLPDTPGCFPFCNFRSAIHRTGDVFEEVRRYFCGNTVHGSKLGFPSSRIRQARLPNST
jgi:hypothetical protein